MWLCYAMFHTARLILHLSWLAFVIKWKKSSPHPPQCVEYLGDVLNSRSLWVVLSEPRWMDLLQMVQRRGTRVTVLTMMQVLGFMATAHPATGAAADASPAMMVCQSLLGCQCLANHGVVTHKPPRAPGSVLGSPILRLFALVRMMTTLRQCE